MDEKLSLLRYDPHEPKLTIHLARGATVTLDGTAADAVVAALDHVAGDPEGWRAQRAGQIEIVAKIRGMA